MSCVEIKGIFYMTIIRTIPTNDFVQIASGSAAAPKIDLSFIADKGTPLSELRSARNLTKKEAIKAIQELEAHGYINIVKSRTGKIKVFLADKAYSLTTQDIYVPTMGDK